jgi:hypothetical protein
MPHMRLGSSWLLAAACQLLPMQTIGDKERCYLWLWLQCVSFQ